MAKAIYCLVIFLILSTIGIKLAGRFQIATPFSSCGDESLLIQPLLASWSMADQPLIASSDISFATHIIVLTDNYTAIIYSMPIVQANVFLIATSVNLQDEGGHINNLVKAISLKQFGSLEFGVLYFEPRQLDTHSFSISFGKIKLSILLCSVIGSGNQALISPPGKSSIYRENYFEQLGYQISFNAWTPYKGDRAAEMLHEKGETIGEVFHRRATEEANTQQSSATPTPIPIELTNANIPMGKPVDA